jgi:alpha-beta hydrolase superfamily lysophospholipase
MPTISTSCGTIAYDSRGRGDPIVLLPSGGHDLHDYDEVRDLLPDRFCSIAIDWPGHGQSPAGTAPATELRLTRAVVIDSGHLPHTTKPAAVAGELTTLADSAFDNDGRDSHGRTSDTQHSHPARKEQQ